MCVPSPPKLFTTQHICLFTKAGCTQQACGYRDIYPDFEALNYKVYCLSADSPTAQEKWQTKVNISIIYAFHLCFLTPALLCLEIPPLPASLRPKA